MFTLLPNLYVFHIFWSVNVAHPNGAILKILLLFLCMKIYLQTELEFNPDKFGII